MAFVVADRVREYSTTTGTGTLTLSGAPLGYQTFSTAIGNGNTTYYTISNPGINEWEVGIGTVAAGTLARTTLISSSTGSFVSFTAGNKDVFCTYPAEKSVFMDSAATFASLDVSGQVNFTSTGAMLIPKGATGDRPTGVSGDLRFNTTTNEFEGYNGSTWASVGGSAISNDTSTSSNIYPISAAATSGSASTVYTSNAKYLYKPSTGELQASEMLASNGIFSNSATVATSYSIQSGYNAMSSGPVTVNSGITVTVPSGSVWTIV